MGLIKFVEDLKRFERSGLQQILESTLTEFSDDITRLNKEQLRVGKRPDGSDMPFYSPNTVLIRQQSGNPVLGDKIALNDFGDFWKGFFATARSNKLIISSKDSKTEMLINTPRYGDFLGLTNENFEFLFNKMLPTLQNKTNEFFKQ